MALALNNLKRVDMPLNKETISLKKIFTNGLNMALSLKALVKKTVKVETYWLFSKEKIPGATVSKEGQAGSVLEHERTHHY